MKNRYKIGLIASSIFVLAALALFNNSNPISEPAAETIPKPRVDAIYTVNQTIEMKIDCNKDPRESFLVLSAGQAMQVVTEGHLLQISQADPDGQSAVLNMDWGKNGSNTHPTREVVIVDPSEVILLEGEKGERATFEAIPSLTTKYLITYKYNPEC